MVMVVKIGIEGAPAFHRMIGIAREAVEGVEYIWRDVVHPWFLEHMRIQFETSGRWGGDEWAAYPNEPKYRKKKESMVGHLRPLVWEWGGKWERLRPSLMEAGHIDHIFEASEKGVVLGTAVPYASALNVGGTGPFNENFPARRMMSMTPGQKKELVTLMQREMIDRLKDGVSLAEARV